MFPDTNLDPIDRWYSELLDVHVWSHHPEIRELTNTLYDELGIASLESKSNMSVVRVFGTKVGLN